jgi:hypothetical protein
MQLFPPWQLLVLPQSEYASAAILGAIIYQGLG